MNSYIILRSSGNVRNSRIRFVAEVEASDAKNALEDCLPDHARTWIIRQDCSDDFCRIEDPATFTSDRIGGYTAVRGSLRRFRNGDLLFLVGPSDESREMEDGIKGPTRRIRAMNAGAALGAYLERNGLDLKVLSESPYQATAVTAPLRPAAYTAQVVYVLKRKYRDQ